MFFIKYILKLIIISLKRDKITIVSLRLYVIISALLYGYDCIDMVSMSSILAFWGAIFGLYAGLNDSSITKASANMCAIIVGCMAFCLFILSYAKYNLSIASFTLMTFGVFWQIMADVEKNFKNMRIVVKK